MRHLHEAMGLTRYFSELLVYRPKVIADCISTVIIRYFVRLAQEEIFPISLDLLFDDFQSYRTDLDILRFLENMTSENCQLIIIPT